MEDFHSEIDIMSHLGTHIEAPYHHANELKDNFDVSLDHYISRCVVLDLADIQPKHPIAGEDLDRADRGRVKKGDFVLLKSPFYFEPFTELANSEQDKRPYLNDETGRWLAEKGVFGVGFDNTISIEFSKESVKAFHEILMRKDVVFLEVMHNFDQLNQDVFLLMCVPLPIKGLDSCPVRPIAIEGIPGLA
jgi:kynurenine formamidase